jgi:lipopolysaccharide/colanic/teichoic acid biosynthesis glycosyltransferase
MSLPAPARAYYNGRMKRVLDLLLAILGLLVLSPLLLVLAMAVLLSSGPPVLFLHVRAGRGGSLFRLYKFRTMRRGSESGLPITASGDSRVTLVGRFLRATKLDELPQLLNVIKGEMSLVGPRPEVPRYVEAYTTSQRAVLDARPGLTDPATVLFRDEEWLLGRVDGAQREAYYLKEILPRKLAMNLDYLNRASLPYDLLLLLKTARAILIPPTRTKA